MERERERPTFSFLFWADISMLTLPPFNRTWRSSLILAFASCYLMWFITFMAQLHPLIEPRRNDVREDFVSE